MNTYLEQVADPLSSPLSCVEENGGEMWEIPCLAAGICFCRAGRSVDFNFFILHPYIHSFRFAHYASQ
jgi:hypothetical protein